MVAVAPDRVAALTSVIAPTSLRPWQQVKRERRVERRRWLRRHPDTLIAVILMAFGLLLIPLPGPGWALLSAGVLLLVVASAIRTVIDKR